MKEWFLHSWGLIPELLLKLQGFLHDVLCFFFPSFIQSSLTQCLCPTPASGPQGEPLWQHHPAADAPLEAALSIRGSSSSCPSKESINTSNFFSHPGSKNTTVFHCHFPAVTVLWTHRTGKEIHVFEPNPIDAKSPFKLQQELNFSTKSVNPFLAESHFKENWPDKILFFFFFDRKEHF